MPLADPTKQECIGRVRRHISGLRGDIGAWLCDRKRKDQHQQYATQLTVLLKQFDFMLGELERQFGGISDAGSRRQVYADCRELEYRLLFVRRVFLWFRSKFDQRDDKALAPVLAAADEVVWSCYAEPFRNSGAAQGSAPLPFIEPAYSPSAIPRVDPPQDLRSDIDAEYLKRMLNELPVPVVALPPNCAEEPWWLAFLAHEVGHHVEFDLLPRTALVGHVAAVLEQAGGSRWRYWGQEVFADFYSVLMLGPWAAWILNELVWGSDLAMLNDGVPRYPSPLVRLLFMTAAGEQLGIESAAGLRGLDPDKLLEGPPLNLRGHDPRETAGADRQSVASVAHALLQPLAALGDRSLADLCAFEKEEFEEPQGRVHLWSQALRDEVSLGVVRELRAARAVLGGAVKAWAAIADIENEEERATARKQLADHTITKILASREETTRAASAPAGEDLETHNRRLAELLMRMPPQRQE
ncbi:MAG: hypothetical protein M1436_09285 [Acidobacteria bacterium]|nr:hypothetical protein [Acidobacteriota bacterium]